MSVITVKTSDAYLDENYANKRRIKFMVNEIANFGDRTALLRELKNLEKSGVCSAVPPVIGFLTRIGYFSNREVLLDAICILNAWEA